MSKHIRPALTFFLCAWLAYNLYETVLRVAAYYVPLPAEDYWRVAANLPDYRSLRLAVFWRQHNEHRIVFPEIVFALDMLVAHGRLILPLAASFLCYALTWVVLWLPVMGDRGIDLSSRSLAILATGVLAFWQGSALALAQPFLLEWPLMQLGVALALFWLKKAGDRASLAYLASAIAAAVVATYSSANALLLWPLLLAMGLWIRLPKSFLAALAASAVVFVGLYFVGYTFSQQTNLRALLLHPGLALGFVASYLSMPFGGLSVGLAVFIGLANLLLFIVLVALAWRARLLATPPAVVLIGYYLFTLLTVLITAAGRLDLADPNFTAAKVPRYLTVPFLNWAALLLLCFWLSARLKWRIFNAVGLTAAFALLMPVGQHKLRPWLEENSHDFADYQWAALSVDNGLLDSQILSRIFPSPEFIAANLPGLKQNRLSVFYRDHEKWLGRNISQFGAVSTAPARGAIVYTYPVEHGLEVVGWVDAPDLRDPQPRIFLVNERGQVVGFGRHPAAGFPVELNSLQTPNKEAWVGFVNSQIPSRSVSAYVALRHGLAAIEGAATVPALEAASAADLGPAIQDSNWQLASAWTLEAIPVKPRFGWRPAAPSYSSWSGRDQNTGRASAAFAAPTSGCVALPVLHGPSISGLAAELIDADSGSVLAEFPFRNQDALWSLWRVRVNANVKRLQFVAVDNGAGWGQWLAVSAPIACR